MKIVGKIELQETKAQKVKVVLPEKVLVYFQADKDGKIIGRLESGKIAIIDRNRYGIVKSGEEWMCKVISYENTKIIVCTISIKKSASACINELSESIKRLQEAGIKTTATFKPKNAIFYAKIQ